MGFPFPKASYSFPLTLMLTDGSHSSFRGFSVPLPAPIPAVTHQLHAVMPAAMLSAILCLKDQKSSSSALWLLHSKSSSPHKAVLLRHHQGTAQG